MKDVLAIPAPLPKKKRKVVRKVGLHIRGIHPETKAIFKAYCARRGYPMAQAVIYLMREAVEKRRVLNLKGVDNGNEEAGVSDG